MPLARSASDPHQEVCCNDKKHSGTIGVLETHDPGDKHDSEQQGGTNTTRKAARMPPFNNPARRLNRSRSILRRARAWSSSAIAFVSVYAR